MKRPSKKIIVCGSLLLVCLICVVCLTRKHSKVPSGDNEETSTQQISSTADFNRALVDISKFMSIHDDKSYTEAKTSMNYSGDVGKKYFSSNSTFVSYSGQTSVEIHEIGLKKSNLDSKIREYMAKVLVTGYDYSGNSCNEVYLVEISYNDSLITEITKIKMN